MNRLLLTVAAVALGTSARGQDMPLSQILLDGEGWKPADGVRPMFAKGIGFTGGGHFGYRWNTRPGDPAVYNGFPQDRREPDRYPIPLKDPAGLSFSPDGGTLFVADAADKSVWAFSMRDYKPTAGAPYCPLRVRPGTTASQATGLTVDKDGRVYVATPLGVQVFDPTGRLCGVMHGPGGPMGVLTLEGNQLTTWVGDAKYVRKLNAAGLR